MPSDIYVKQGSGWSTAVKNIYAKTNSGWSSAIRYVYAKINAGWTRVWPLSGVYPNTNPFISNNTTTTSEISFGTVLRVGTTYKGDRGDWNPNGYTITSYDYKWLSFSAESGGTENYDSGYSTLSGTTSTFTITGTTLANFDRGWIAFRVRANASNSAYSGTADSLRYYVVRQKPILASGGSPVLSNNNPAIGDTINYSSGWNTTDAYKIDSGRSTIKWYRSASTSLTESQLKALTPIQSSTSSPAPASPYSYTVTSSDIGNYIYAMEEVFNSGTDLESSVNGVTAIVRTTSAVQATPNAFTYTISNVSSVTTPNTPTQTRVSSTSNDILFEFASGKPADTLDYTLNLSGPVTNAGNNTIGTLNLFTNSSDYQTTLTGSGNVSSYVIANGTTRSYQANVSTTTGAQSWRVNVTYTQGALSETFDVDTNSMPVRIVDITGATNPNVSINSITAYSGLNQTGGTKAGTPGSPVTINGLARPTATSGTSTSNYTFYVNNQATGSQRRVNLPSNFTGGTNLYISTNGFIGIGSDPSGSISLPTSGLYLALFQGDQKQTALWTYADASNFYVRWQGARYSDASQTIDYQVKFYWNSTAVDVYFVTNNLSTSNPPSTTAIYNNGVETVNWSASTSQTSTLINTSSMTRNTTQDGVDDNRTAITAVLPPTATNLARADGTVTPSQPSAITFSSSNNQVTSSWTNGSPVTSVRFQGSGAGVNTDYTDSSAPFITSDLSNYSSSATYTATVTNFNNSLLVNVSWTQTNAQSYSINYTSSVFGADAITGNFSGTNASVDIAWTTGLGSFTLNSVTVYSGLNQTGTSNTFFSGLSAITPSQKSSSRSGSVSLTYSLPKLATPTNVSASDNRTDGINITWSAVSGAAYYGVWYGPVPSYDSTPDFGGPNNPNLITGTSYLDTSMGGGVTRNYYVQAFRSGNPAGTKSDWSAGDSGTRLSAVSPPSNTSQPTLSGSLSVGSTVTFGVGSWSNSPTSYDLRLYRGTQFVSSGETLVKSAGNVTSSTYTITQADFNSGQLYLRAFASASNSGGSSGLVAGQEIGPITAGGSAPGTPTGLNSVYNGGTSYTFSWTAVSGATSYQIIPYHATSSAGAGSTAKSSRNFTSGSTYDSSADGGTSATYVSFAVRATNANGSSAYSAIYTPYR